MQKKAEAHVPLLVRIVALRRQGPLATHISAASA